MQHYSKRVEEIAREQQELKRQFDVLDRHSVVPGQLDTLRKSIGQQRDEYVSSLKTLRECFDLVKQLYDEAAQDSKVKTTVGARNQGLPQPKWILGPSPKLREVESKLKLHEKWVEDTSTMRGVPDASKGALPSPPPTFWP